jgi:hypothetical protein
LGHHPVNDRRPVQGQTKPSIWKAPLRNAELDAPGQTLKAKSLFRGLTPVSWRGGIGSKVGVEMIDTKIRISRCRRLGLVRWIGLATLSLLVSSPAVQANQCFTSGPRYQLVSDTVDWRMTLHSNENCVRGVRFSYVYNASVSLGSPPISGDVTVLGPGFSYTAKPGFLGEDSFVVIVSGSKNKMTGYSKIRVLVSVVAASQNSRPSFARFDER